jgi:hypothetical protein
MIYFAVFVCHANIGTNGTTPDGHCFLMSEAAATYATVPHPEAFIRRNLTNCHETASEAAALVAKSIGKEVAVQLATQDDPRYLIVYRGRTLEWVECRRLSWGSAE